MSEDFDWLCAAMALTEVILFVTFTLRHEDIDALCGAAIAYVWAFCALRYVRRVTAADACTRAAATPR